MMATGKGLKTMGQTEKTTERTRLLVMTGLLAALGCVATMALVVPSPTGGYMNPGDAVVLLGAYLLGPVCGAAAGGIGPALADLLLGAPVYVPATLVIKALMGLLAAALYRALGKGPGAVLAAGAAAETVMVAGYWLYDALLLASSGGISFGTALAGSAAGIPSNLAQAVFGLAASALLVLALKRSGYVRRTFPAL